MYLFISYINFISNNIVRTRATYIMEAVINIVGIYAFVNIPINYTKFSF